MFRSAQTVLVGQTLGRQPHRLFGIKPVDRLSHQFIIGQTGTGKSTLLLNQMKQDLIAGNGYCLIDPHGDLAAALTDQVHRDVIYWDAASQNNNCGYNPLARVSAQFRPLVATGLIETLRYQWKDAWGPRMENLLRHALLALLEYPGATIADIMPLFLDKNFQRRVVNSVTDEHVRQFWTVEFDSMKYKGTVDGVAPIANKLGGFLAHPLIRKAMCAPEKPLRFRQIMDHGKILVVNLARGRLGSDTANILGGLILSNLAHAAYSRQNIPEFQRGSFYAYVDEFSSFTSAVFADMLSELRKYAMGLVLAGQYASQTDTDIFEAILGNVGTLTSFRVGARDAHILAKQFGGDIPSARDLINLPNYEMYVKMMIDGAQSKPFSARTLKP
ncbi:MAG: hypothetical protein AAF870_06600 [Pseudomonadota bacterium]